MSDLSAVLARVAEKLHGWEAWNLDERLLTWQGTGETIERMRKLGFRVSFHVDISTGEYWAGFNSDECPVTDKGLTEHAGFYADTAQEAIIRAADAALGSTRA